VPSGKTARNPDPAAAFARWQQEILAHSPDLTPDLYADDVVVEAPFTGTASRTGSKGWPPTPSSFALAGPACRSGSPASRMCSSTTPRIPRRPWSSTGCWGSWQGRCDRRRSSSWSPWMSRTGSSGGASTRTGQRSRPPWQPLHPLMAAPALRHVDHGDASGVHSWNRPGIPTRPAPTDTPARPGFAPARERPRQPHQDDQAPDVWPRRAPSPPQASPVTAQNGPRATFTRLGVQVPRAQPAS